MTIREKVARVICIIEGYFPWEHLTDAQKDGARETAAAAITAFLETAAETGWHMRPDEATPEMKHAAFVAMDNASCRGDPKARAWDCLKGHRAMQAAAPEFKWDD